MIFDFYFIFWIMLFITGGVPFTHGHLQTIFQGTPWMHRLFISLATGIMIVWFIKKQHAACKNQMAISPLIAKLQKNGLTPHSWKWIIFLVLSIVWSISSCIRYTIFEAGFDMAIFVQSIWNTLHGDFLYSSIKGNICLLGDHFSPFLGMLVFPYALWTDPKCLLIIQGITTASCVFPIFRIADHHLKDTRWAILFVICFALYLPVRNAVRFDFHPEMLAAPLLLWAFFFLETKRSIAASLCMVLALTTKENVALATFSMGFFGFWFRKRFFFGLFWMFFSIAYLLLAINVFIPHFSGDSYFYLKGNFSAWKNLGMLAFIKQLLGPSTYVYLFKVLGPFGFLNFLSPSTLVLAIPVLFQNLTARNEQVRSIFFHYTAILTPLLFISLIYGCKHLKHKKFCAYYLITCSLLLSGVSEWYVIDTAFQQWTQKIRERSKYLQKIPQNASVRTHEFFAAHLAHRHEVYIFENDHPNEGGSPKALSADYVVLDRDLLGNTAKKDFTELFNMGYFRIFEKNGLTILNKSKSLETHDNDH